LELHQNNGYLNIYFIVSAHSKRVIYTQNNDDFNRLPASRYFHYLGVKPVTSFLGVDPLFVGPRQIGVGIDAMQFAAVDWALRNQNYIKIKWGDSQSMATFFKHQDV
jgi:hypothetical protein